jgi:hypothetical protein
MFRNDDTIKHPRKNTQVFHLAQFQRALARISMGVKRAHIFGEQNSVGQGRGLDLCQLASGIYKITRQALGDKQSGLDPKNQTLRKCEMTMRGLD